MTNQSKMSERVLNWLTEGNSLEDLAELYWSKLSDAERAELETEVNTACEEAEQ